MIPYQHLSIDTVNVGGFPGGINAGTVAAVSNLLDSAKYANPRYFPTVGASRVAALAGQSPYAEVEDVITLDVLGPTASQCVRNANELIALIMQAGDWNAGELVLPVQVRAQFPGVGAVQSAAIMLGPSPGAAAAALAPAYDVTASCWIIRDLELRFVRRALWLERRLIDTTAQSSYETIGSLVTAAGGSLVASDILLPTVAEFQGENADDVWSNCVLLLANGASRIATVQAGVIGFGGTGYTNVASGSALSFGANLLRQTVAVNNAPSLTSYVSTTLPADTQLVGVAATVRANTSGNTWRVRFSARTVISGAVVDPAFTGAVFVVGAAVARPETIIVSPVTLRSASNSTQVVELAVEVTRITGTGSTTFDIDEIVLIALDAAGSTIIVATPTVAASTTRYLALSPGERPQRVGSLGVDLRGEAATVVAGRAFWQYRGDVAFATDQTSITGVALATSDLLWRPADGGGNPVVVRLEVFRANGGMVPV